MPAHTMHTHTTTTAPSARTLGEAVGAGAGEHLGHAQHVEGMHADANVVRLLACGIAPWEEEGGGEEGSDRESRLSLAYGG